ncbi:MAG: hypothetical protein ACHBN1_04090 [Heteroscytonema crispum UTEX LB 1556]
MKRPQDRSGDGGHTAHSQRCPDRGFCPEDFAVNPNCAGVRTMSVRAKRDRAAAGRVRAHSALRVLERPNEGHPKGWWLLVGEFISCICLNSNTYATSPPFLAGLFHSRPRPPGNQFPGG